MKKKITLINTTFIYDPMHKGAHFSFNGGVSWCNAGEAHEIITKACYGYKAIKDANTSYNIDSDIPELNASVKSAKATLVNMYLGEDMDSVLKVYFENVHSSLWIWAVMIDENLITYEMNRQEFEEFTREWAGYDANRKVVRYKTSSTKMMKWLDERVER